MAKSEPTDPRISVGEQIMMTYFKQLVRAPVIVPDICSREKLDPQKKTKSETTGSSGGSASGSIYDYVSEDLRRKLQAGTSAYEAKKAKEMAMIEFKEMEFLTIDADSLPEPKNVVKCNGNKQKNFVINKHMQSFNEI
ncbi:hypothetical protein Tco_1309248 [Tanacetum coccineum]